MPKRAWVNFGARCARARLGAHDPEATVSAVAAATFMNSIFLGCSRPRAQEGRRPHNRTKDEDATIFHVLSRMLYPGLYAPLVPDMFH